MGAITREQGRDAGMALVLLFLLAAIRWQPERWLIAALVVQVLVMTAPGLFRPWAFLWFGLAHALGAVSSRVLLSLVFLVVVTPIGLIRRLAGKDALRLTAFKRGSASVMTVRNQTFAAADLEQPY